MDQFIRPVDVLSKLINEQATELYHRMEKLPVGKLNMPPGFKDYFLKSHFHRLFFSIETSAQLLYRALKGKLQLLQDIVVMDYGAGVGSLYLLAKMIGCRVIYNDLLEEWQQSAVVIAEQCGVYLDEYIVGDIRETLEKLSTLKINCDCITSRNVIEHIYRLEDFYAAIHQHQPQAAIYSSTTANYYNPALHVQHIRWHQKCEKKYVRQRREIISQKLPQLPASVMEPLSLATRGLAGRDLDKAVENFANTGKLPDPSHFYTNTCDPENGVWAEQLLTFGQYRSLINETNYQVTFLPGGWDTHYRNNMKNRMTRVFNQLIRLGGQPAFVLAPFLYVVAQPRNFRQSNP